MKKWFLICAVLLFSMPVYAVDLANGEQLNRNCALCHGVFGQGTAGRLSPRLAGLPKEYLIKALGDYTHGKRINPTMMEAIGLADMPMSDIEDVSAYLNMLDLGRDARFNVPQTMPGDPKAGKGLFKGDCKTCHGKDGRGKPKKEAPPIAGQHSEYIFQSIKMFQGRLREHDNDPEDETFDDYSDQEIMDIIAFVTSLDDARVVEGEQFIAPKMVMSEKKKAQIAKAKSPGLKITDISQTVAQMALKEGVDIQDAIDAMRSKAIDLNLKLVGEQHVSKELEARGVETPYLSIFQFCNPMDAKMMIVNNPIFASYMPCRISLVEDQEGVMHLMMLNLDMLINSALVSRDVVDTAIRVNQQMLEIMVAGATGEF